MSQSEIDDEKFLRFENNMLNGRLRILCVLIFVSLEILVIYCSFYRKGQSFSMEWPLTLALTIVIVVLLFVALSAKITVFIFENRIEVRVLKKYVVMKDDIASTEVKRPDALHDFGGWGVKVGDRKRGYLVPGQEAVYLTLKDGTLVVICDDNPVRMNEIIRSAMRL